MLCQYITFSLQRKMEVSCGVGRGRRGERGGGGGGAREIQAGSRYWTDDEPTTDNPAVKVSDGFLLFTPATLCAGVGQGPLEGRGGREVRGCPGCKVCKGDEVSSVGSYQL